MPNCSVPELTQQSVYIWRLPLGRLQKYKAACFSVLSQDEQEKAECYRFDLDQAAYILTRGALRYVLSGYCQRSPEEIGFHIETNGKPKVVLPSLTSKIEFNVSHTREQAAIAISCFPVGVDIESTDRDLDPLALAKRFFHESEYEALCRLPPAFQKEAFMYTWVCKEAWVKAHGTGIAENLKNFEVNVDPAKPPHIIQASDKAQWRYWPLEVAADHRGTLVTDSRIETLSYCDVEPLLA
ncbi:MAG: 4-phosphopantetheinyl transferase [Gammaproteobacteria bacterium]|jgi:4'-phosphopantetheinyl transferase|nr:4-phosphopantetheinyl transferase [Gammaproteobacteria bacterium]